MIVTPLVLLSSLIGHSQHSLTPLVLLVLFPFCFVLSFLILSRATQRIATLTEAATRGNNHWLRGAKPQFLDRLPLFPRK